MKHFYTFILAALTAVPSLAQQTTTAVATFDNVEGVTLNTDSVYNGSTAKATDSVTYESYGSTVTTYYCNFKQGPFTLLAEHHPGMGLMDGIRYLGLQGHNLQELCPRTVSQCCGRSLRGVQLCGSLWLIRQHNRRQGHYARVCLHHEFGFLAP